MFFRQKSSKRWNDTTYSKTQQLSSMRYIGGKGKELRSRQTLCLDFYRGENNLVYHKEKAMWNQMMWTRKKSGVLRWKRDQHKWKNSTAQEESEEITVVKIVDRENYETKNQTRLRLVLIKIHLTYNSILMKLNKETGIKILMFQQTLWLSPVHCWEMGTSNKDLSL